MRIAESVRRLASGHFQPLSIWGRAHAIMAKDAHARSVEVMIRPKTEVLRGLLSNHWREDVPRFVRARTEASIPATFELQVPLLRRGENLRPRPCPRCRGRHVRAQIKTVLSSSESSSS